jgi:hypothetical protein
MKASILSTFVLALAATKVAAFPKLAAEHRERLAASQQGKRSTAAASPHKKRVVFDAKSQYVSTTGDHSFVPPNYGAGDVRGPCPGLNAAANHNYISRNGVANGRLHQGCERGIRNGSQPRWFPCHLRAIFDGNLEGYSIGGRTSNVALPLNNLLGLTGAPQGLSGSHNKYESDASPTRGDIHM